MADSLTAERDHGPGEMRRCTTNGSGHAGKMRARARLAAVTGPPRPFVGCPVQDTSGPRAAFLGQTKTHNENNKRAVS